MTRTRWISFTVSGTALLLLVLFFGVARNRNLAHDESGEEGSPGRVIPVAGDPLQVQIELGRDAERQAVWKGTVRVDGGRVMGLEVVRAGRNPSVEGDSFEVRPLRVQPSGKKKKKKQPGPALLGALLKVRLDAPPEARITVETSQGAFAFQPGDLASGEPVVFLNGQAAVTQETTSIRLTGPNTEDDFPVLAEAADGMIWMAYVEYTPGQPLIMEQVANRRFDSLVPKGNGDRIRLRKFDGEAWSKPVDVTGGGLDVWRPTISVDGKGNVVVAWAQKKEGNWDIFYRKYAPDSEKWSDAVQVSKNRGSDFHVVSTTDSNGYVWLVWQGWRDGLYVNQVYPIDHPDGNPGSIGVSKANNWAPSVTADSRGYIYIAGDAYVDGSYGVTVYQVGPGRMGTHAFIQTPRYEAKPHIVCDDADRLWLAYEEGDVHWGQDYQGNNPQRVGLTNPGNGLYVNRTVTVKCIVDGQIMEPEADLQKAFAGELERNKSIPRLVFDKSGGVNLFFRHHPRSGGQGEVWHSYAVRYDGKKWSEPRELPNSSNIMDNRPALLAYRKGILAVHSSDQRTNTRSRDQHDLYATNFNQNGAAAEAELKKYQPEPIPRPEPVHPNEDEAIARMRNHRVKVGDKTLQLIRGEFHRHTEYTAHRDQDGTLEDSWRYAIDVGKLDWMGNGDHDNGFGHEYLWWQIQKICDLYHNGPDFIAALTYERSVRYPSGHRNVMFAKRGIRPLPRLGGGNEILYGTAEEGSPDIKLLYDYLKHFGGICSSHTSGTNMGTDWRDNDPEVEPVVEIYQGHRHNYEHLGAPRSATEETAIGGYRPDGTVWHALEKGYRLGFQSSSDHVSTHMSYAVVLVEEASRQGIIDAFKKRHSYGATDNILLVVRSGNHLMGDEFTTKERPGLQIQVHGATDVAKVHVVRSNKYVYTAEPNKQKVELSYRDMDIEPGEMHYYYVRVEQSDGNIAWGSPMWITYQPGH